MAPEGIGTQRILERDSERGSTWCDPKYNRRTDVFAILVSHSDANFLHNLKERGLFILLDPHGLWPLNMLANAIKNYLFFSFAFHISFWMLRIHGMVLSFGRWIHIPTRLNYAILGVPKFWCVYIFFLASYPF